MHAQFLPENLQGKGHVVDLGIDRR